tara:strand:+ start:324 stop:566 length:243 start_codon:yes stop_codon:yes gene_type:complete
MRLVELCTRKLPSNGNVRQQCHFYASREYSLLALLRRIRRGGICVENITEIAICVDNITDIGICAENITDMAILLTWKYS